MALKLGDALIRRTEAGAAGHPGADALERAAAIMARAHGWDDWRTRNEIAEVEAFYRLPTTERKSARRRETQRPFFRGEIDRQRPFFIGENGHFSERKTVKL